MAFSLFILVTDVQYTFQMETTGLLSSTRRWLLVAAASKSPPLSFCLTTLGPARRPHQSTFGRRPRQPTSLSRQTANTGLRGHCDRMDSIHRSDSRPHAVACASWGPCTQYQIFLPHCSQWPGMFHLSTPSRNGLGSALSRRLGARATATDRFP